MKTLVVYYSMDGNTKEAAEKIAAEIGADIVEIKPEKPLSSKGGKKYFIGGMQATFGMSPPISKITTDISLYDRIILGTPVWARKPAPYINSFLNQNGAKEKVTAVFVCSGGGGCEICISSLNKKLSNMKHSVSLLDRSNRMAENNDKLLKEFINKIKG